MFGKYVLLRLCLTGTAAFAQQGNRIDLGRLQAGATAKETFPLYSASVLILKAK